MKRLLFIALKGSLYAFLFFSSLFLICPEKADAGLLGDIIEWQYYFDGGEFNFVGSPGSFVAGSSSSTFGSGDPSYFTISANDSQIIFDYSVYLFDLTVWSTSGASLDENGLYIENGIRLTDDTNVITSVSIDSLTNMAGFSLSNITFNSNNIAINWADLPFDGATRVVLNIGTSAAVPEPTTLLLFGSGLVGLLTGRRMLKR